MSGDLDVLARAHALFSGAPARGSSVEAALGRAGEGRSPALSSAGSLAAAYRQTAEIYRVRAAAARRVDATLLRLLAGAAGDHDEARYATGAVLAAARADTVPPDNPIAAREMLRRRVVRLRTQQRHVLAARRRARRRRAALLALGYRGRDPRADRAVRAALTRLGLPYVWGATGPDRFDCSGLVKWAYAQAGVPLRRTTYEQILDGLPVPRSQIRPGDLVFPHTGHVQLAIGHDLVVEAPYSGASVRISALGPDVAIRRPV